ARARLGRMNVTRSPWFREDVERRGEYFLREAGERVLRNFLEAVFFTLEHLASFPECGIAREFEHPDLQALRFIPLSRPYDRYLVFYRVHPGEVIVERLMHGYRDLPRRLLEPPGVE